MKKIILAITCALCLQNSFAAPASPASTQKLIESFDLENYIADTLSDDNLYNVLTDHIISIYLPDISDNKQVHTRIKQAIKSYYIGPNFKEKYTQDIYNVYQENYSEEETQAWIQFYQTAEGKSLLKNKNFTQGLSKALEQLFHQEHDLSEENQQKVENLVYQLIQDN